MEPSKFLLSDHQIPSIWINVLPSLSEPLSPPLNPQTRQPLAPQDLAADLPDGADPAGVFPAAA